MARLFRSFVLNVLLPQNFRDARRKPGKTVAETTSMYLNPSDDSDYVPSDAQTSGNLFFKKKG